MTSWTRERVELLRGWWAKGLSAGIIAGKFYAEGFIISRSAICGKISRLGLCKRTNPRKQHITLWKGSPGRVLPPKAPKPVKVRAAVALEPAPVVFREPVVYGLDGGPVGCRWIEGHVGTPGWFYCNADVKRGSYCAAHAFMCYRPDPSSPLAASHNNLDR